MPLFLSERDVQELLPMERALEVVEESFVAQHKGRAVNQPRQRIFLPGASLHYLAAALPEKKALGIKIYTVTGEGFRFVVLLFDSNSGALNAMIEADQLGRIRTGAASGIATKYLARPDASRLGMIGAGRQARTQLEAVARVRAITAAQVFSRDELRRQTFCHEMSEYLNLPVRPAESAEAAVRFGNIVISATTSAKPVIRGEWLKPGTHVNAIGANKEDRSELDDGALARASVIAVDSLEQARVEAGDLIQGLGSIHGGWSGVSELHDIIGESKPGRSSAGDITIFKSCGIALWDVAAAAYIYDEAVRKGKGNEVEILGAGGNRALRL